MDVGGADHMGGDAGRHPTLALYLHHRVGAGQHPEGQMDGAFIPLRHDHCDVAIAPDQEFGARPKLLPQRDQIGRRRVFAEAVCIVVVEVKDCAGCHILAAVTRQGQPVVDVVIVPTVAGDMFVECADGMQRLAGNEEEAVDMGLFGFGCAPVASDKGAGQQVVATKEVRGQYDVGVCLEDQVAGSGTEPGIESVGQDPALFALDPQNADSGVRNSGCAQVVLHRRARGPVNHNNLGYFGVGEPRGQRFDEVLAAVHRAGDQADAGAAVWIQGAKVAHVPRKSRRHLQFTRGAEASFGQGGFEFDAI